MNSDKLRQAIALILEGDKRAALSLLSKLVQEEPYNEAAWICLFECVESVSKKKYCLQKILAINPDNQNARSELEKLTSKHTVIARSIQEPLSVKNARSGLPVKREPKWIYFDGWGKRPNNLRYIPIMLGILIFCITSVLFYYIGRYGISAQAKHPLLPNIEVTRPPLLLRQIEHPQPSAMPLFHAGQPILPLMQAEQLQSLASETPLSPTYLMEQSLNGYLTAIEGQNWVTAYEYLCAEIRNVVRSPNDMAYRVFLELGRLSIPDTHKILPPPDRPNRVIYNLTSTTWWGGPYEARVEMDTYKICGIGKERGDLRNLLIPFETPLNISQ